MKRRTVLDGQIVLDRMPGYIRVWHGRSAHTLEEAQGVLDAMDQAMRDWSVDRLLFDSRDADVTPKDVGARIWSWLSEHPDLARVATLVQSEDLADSINMGGVGNDVRIRAFHTEPAAARWLTILT